MKKLVTAFFVGYFVSNLQFAYADGLFARADNMLKGKTQVDTQNLGEVFKYLFEGYQNDDDQVMHLIMQMTAKGYRDIEIADHLGIDVIAVRLVRKASNHR